MRISRAKSPSQWRATGHPSTNHPKNCRYASHSARCAKNQWHHHAGGIHRHESKTQGLALPVCRRNLMQCAHDHGLNNTQHQTQTNRTNTHGKRRFKKWINAKNNGGQNHGPCKQKVLLKSACDPGQDHPNERRGHCKRTQDGSHHGGAETTFVP